MIKITQDQVISIHSLTINENGGIDGARDYNLLNSSLNCPFQTFGGDDLYPLIKDKAAMLCYSLAANHAFNDGNKRIGVLAMLVFLDINCVGLCCVDDDIIELGLGIANGLLTFENVVNWIEKYTI